jgi:hypothetical protein
MTLKEYNMIHNQVLEVFTFNLDIIAKATFISLKTNEFSATMSHFMVPAIVKIVSVANVSVDMSYNSVYMDAACI